MVTLTLAKEVGLGSAACGAFGTCLLYAGTFGLQTVGMIPVPHEEHRRVDARNRRRLIFQRAGLTFLLLSFLLAGASVLCGNP